MTELGSTLSAVYSVSVSYRQIHLATVCLPKRNGPFPSTTIYAYLLPSWKILLLNPHTYRHLSHYTVRGQFLTTRFRLFIIASSDCYLLISIFN